jgi:membrane dipeptidase
MSRREFAAFSAFGAFSALGLRPGVPALSRPPGLIAAGGNWPGYDKSIAIDCLATPGPFNVNNMFAVPFTDAAIANVRASGMTAVNVTLNGNGNGPVAFSSTVQNIAFLEHELDTHADVFIKVKTVADIRSAKDTKKLGLIPGFQDAMMLEDEISRVDTFHRLGIRVIQLTYNRRNLLGDGCLEPANAGLSGFGRAAVARMNGVGILVDLSHCGRQTTLDGIEASSKPVSVTHSGCAALSDSPRNKSDEQLRKLADKGGVVGIYLMPYLRAAGQPTADDVLAHIEHAIKVCGEDHVGIGSDQSITPIDATPEYRKLHAETVRERRRLGISAPGESEDVLVFTPDFNSPRRLDQIADRMSARGHGTARIEKVIGGNWLRLFGEAWS